MWRQFTLIKLFLSPLKNKFFKSVPPLVVLALSFITGCDKPSLDFEYYPLAFAPSFDYQYTESPPSLSPANTTPPPASEIIPETTIAPENTEETYNNTPVPRTVWTLWDSLYEGDVQYTLSHKFAELPLNYLGVKLEYIDLRQPLPPLQEDVIGVLCWLPEQYKISSTAQILKWLINVVDQGKKLILINGQEFATSEDEEALLPELWERLGLYSEDNWPSITYEYEVAFKDQELYSFERDLPSPLPDFLQLTISDPATQPVLTLREKGHADREFAIVVCGPKGSFAPDSYLLFKQFAGDRVFYKWYLNPFKFFSKALGLKEMPIPDPSTLAGRRVYYSHIDGDGWNNASFVEDRRGKDPIYCPEIVLRSIVKPAEDLPVTVAPIAANLNPLWNGLEKSPLMAKALFALPQVEVGCHTYSHPFDWPFFKNYEAIKEEAYLSRYPSSTWKSSSLNKLRQFFNRQESFYKLEEEVYHPGEKKELKPQSLGEQLALHYYTPRAYAKIPFSLNVEVGDAVKEINKIAEPSKKVQVYQWSGNTLPWAQAIDATVKLGIKNLNGGDPRFDFDHPSYAYLPGLARRLGSLIQVYSCSSNENLYTSLWTEHYYGFASLPTTLAWSETPIRVKALNFYYHMYSGERLPSLYALLQNLAYIRREKIVPIPASLYCDLVDGFFSSKMTPKGKDVWQIASRGSLQTFRLDKSVFKQVDFEKSHGIIGQRHFQGSLYIYLDQDVDSPLIAVKPMERGDIEPEATQAYLIESRWRVHRLETEGEYGFSFVTEGFGLGEAKWKVIKEGAYLVSAYLENGEKIETVKAVSQNKELEWILFSSAIKPLKIKVHFLEESTLAETYVALSHKETPADKIRFVSFEPIQTIILKIQSFSSRGPRGFPE